MPKRAREISTRTPVRGMSAPLASDGPGIAGAPVMLALAACLWGLMFLTCLWRLLLAVNIWAEPTLGTAQSAAAVLMPRLDLMIGWVVLVIWLMGHEGAGAGRTLRERRVGAIWGVAAALGIALAAAAMGWEQFSGAGGSGTGAGMLHAVGEQLGLLADLWLAGFGLIAVMGELRHLANHITVGRVTLLELWRLLTVQWLLAWLGAVGVAIFLQARGAAGRDALARNIGMRELLFLVPAIGLLPNTLMLVGIQWWNRLVFTPQLGAGGGAERNPAGAMGIPRIRAWLLAMAMVNVGAVLVALRRTDSTLAGVVAMGFAVAMYLVGFPKGAWRGFPLPGRAAGAAWGLFGMGLALMGVQHLLGATDVAHAFFSESWRHVLGVGATGLWLIAMAVASQMRSGNGRPAWGARRWGWMAALAYGLGVAITVALFLLTSLRQGEAQVASLRGLVVGLSLEFGAVTLVGIMLWRGLRTR